MTAAMDQSNEIAKSPTQIVKEAKNILMKSNVQDINGAREHFQAALFEWTEEAEEEDDLSKKNIMIENIIQLWLDFVHFECELRQFKQATKVYESAVCCPVVGSNLKLWESYAKFCIDRSKYSNARKVFVRALDAVKEENENTIWLSFHEFVQKHVDSSMSLDSLKSTINELRNSKKSQEPEDRSETPIEPEVAMKTTNVTISHEQVKTDQQVQVEEKPSLNVNVMVDESSNDNICDGKNAELVDSQATDVNNDTSSMLENTSNDNIPEEISIKEETTDKIEDIESLKGKSEELSGEPKDEENVNQVVDNNVSHSITGFQVEITDSSNTIEESVKEVLNFVVSSVEKDLNQKPGIAVTDTQETMDYTLKEESTTMQMEDVSTNAHGTKRSSLFDTDTIAKRAKLKELLQRTLGKDVKKESKSMSTTLTYFTSIPTTLPKLQGCPVLLFSTVSDEEEKEISGELLESLSDVLKDPKVFLLIRSLKKAQQLNEKKSLHDWQHLIANQMRNGCELYKHQEESKQTSNMEGLNSYHAEQRNVFIDKCRNEQHQFLLRVKADCIVRLRRQQVALQSIGLPVMQETRDLETLSLQRAVIALIIEAEKFYHKETEQKSIPNSTNQNIGMSGSRQSRQSRSKASGNSRSNRRRDSSQKGDSRQGRRSAPRRQDLVSLAQQQRYLGGRRQSHSSPIARPLDHSIPHSSMTIPGSYSQPDRSRVSYPRSSPTDAPMGHSTYPLRTDVDYGRSNSRQPIQWSQVSPSPERGIYQPSDRYSPREKPIDHYEPRHMHEQSSHANSMPQAHMPIRHDQQALRNRHSQQQYRGNAASHQQSMNMMKAPYSRSSTSWNDVNDTRYSPYAMNEPHAHHDNSLVSSAHQHQNYGSVHEFPNSSRSNYSNYSSYPVNSSGNFGDFRGQDRSRHHDYHAPRR